MPGVKIRDAEDGDLAGLNALEARSFASDRMAPQNLKRLLRRQTARLRVASSGGIGTIHGYHLVLFRNGSSVARLYSIAVDDRRRGRGIGGRLLADAEAVAGGRKATVLRLEVREDNLSAIRLYERHGYRLIGTYALYYADKTSALRYEKLLAEPDEDQSAGRRRHRRGG